MLLSFVASAAGASMVGVQPHFGHFGSAPLTLASAASAQISNQRLPVKLQRLVDLASPVEVVLRAAEIESSVAKPASLAVLLERRREFILVRIALAHSGIKFLKRSRGRQSDQPRANLRQRLWHRTAQLRRQRSQTLLNLRDFRFQFAQRRQKL